MRLCLRKLVFGVWRGQQGDKHTHPAPCCLSAFSALLLVFLSLPACRPHICRSSGAVENAAINPVNISGWRCEAPHDAPHNTISLASSTATATATSSCCNSHQHSAPKHTALGCSCRPSPVSAACAGQVRPQAHKAVVGLLGSAPRVAASDSCWAHA